LRETLDSMNLLKTGKKAILMDHLIEAMQNQNTSPPPLDNTEATPTSSSPW